MQRMMKNLKQNAALPLSLLVALTMAGCTETGRLLRTGEP